MERYDPLSSSYILEHTFEDETINEYEKEALQEYKRVLHLVRTQNIETYITQLHLLEKNEHLQNIIERKRKIEMDRIISVSKQNKQEIINSFYAEQTEREKEQKVSLKKNMLFNIVQKYAIILCVLLCIVLYSVFLFSVFSYEYKIDTYVCYTTATGECYHAEDCQYLYASAYKTTVYEAAKKYKKCSRCNPRISKYKTTLTQTEKNYFVPALISIPISVGLYTIIKRKKS